MMRACRAAAVAAATLLLAGCSGDSGGSSQPAQPAAGGQGSDGALVSIPQAQQAAEQWWSDHDQALLHRDAMALTRIDAAPLAQTELALVQAALATGSGILSQARQPSAVHVAVPAQQSWPVPLLAVFDVAAQGGATSHVAVLLTKLDPGSAALAVESATLDGADPSFDTDAAGYVRMGSPATGLGAAYATYMQDVVHASPAPSPAPLASGKLTSDLAAADAAFLHDPGGHSRGTLSTVDIDYSPLIAAAPVFELAGGAGGFSFVAAQRTQTLHPQQGHLLLQDAQRHNYGLDLAPGEYQQITIDNMEFLAVHLPAGGGPATVVGSGGGVAQEG